MKIRSAEHNFYLDNEVELVESDGTPFNATRVSFTQYVNMGEGLDILNGSLHISFFDDKSYHLKSFDVDVSSYDAISSHPNFGFLQTYITQYMMYKELS